ncbi:hypothetical protein E2562_005924 [Oryza meyeriana var. granulata]|uniref:Uncharacterized protein n=1 Tax=Oryza meyeriana var. granulata TaxID=110450 RepID=A0A6G1DVU9_9ORYZ|nr:hypothetical protein E2562_005924 [Oryza meyeriana var. granulata]
MATVQLAAAAIRPPLRLMRRRVIAHRPPLFAVASLSAGAWVKQREPGRVFAASTVEGHGQAVSPSRRRA